MIGIKDNSDLEEILKKQERKNCKINYTERIAKAIVGMHDKLGEDKFNFILSLVIATANNKERQGYKFTSYDFIEILKIGLETVDKM